MGSYDAGTLIRIHDRLSDGRMLVGVFDLDGTVFPVPEHLIEPVD